MSLRNQFKATAMSELENQQKEVDSMFSSNNSYLNIEVGKNKIRIFPKHPGEGNLYIYPKGVHFLPIEVEDASNPGQKKIVNKPVWSGLIHSEMRTCIIDEYIKRVYQASKELPTEDARKSFLSRMTGQRGILMSRTWPVYAHKIKGTTKQFGILELKTSVKNLMNSLASNLDDGSSMITTDPYTDPDTGRAIFITYDNKAEKIEDYYKVGIDINGPTVLTDAELEEFSKLDPLGTIYVNSYKRSDFILAVQGLKRFDEEAEDYNIFSQPDWPSVIEQFSSLYPETEDEEEDVRETPKKTETKKEAPKKVEKKSVEEVTGERDLNWLKTPEEMTKEELLRYIKTEKLGIKPLPGDTVEDIRGLVLRELKLKELSSTKKVEEVEKSSDSVSDSALDFLRGEVGG